MLFRPARFALGLVISAVLVWGGIAAGPLLGRQSAAPPAPQGVAPPPHIEAESAILLDLDTGRILYAKRAHDRRPPGELAKILTALVALERGGLDEEARITHEAREVLGARTGERLSLIPFDDPPVPVAPGTSPAQSRSRRSRPSAKPR